MYNAVDGGPRTLSPGSSPRPSSLNRQGSATLAPSFTSSSPLTSSLTAASSSSSAVAPTGHGSSTSAAALPKNKSKSRKEKAEASALRSNIAAKEFELHRLEKLIKKKGSLGAAQEISGAAGGTGTAGTNNASATQAGQAMMTVLSSQQSELKELKDAYYKLTGVHYENSTRRRFLPGKLRNNASVTDKPKNAPFAAAYAAAAVTGGSRVPNDSGSRLLADAVAYPKIWRESL